MDDVAAAAGVTKATLYKHFESKDKLVSACLTAVDRKHFDWFVDQATQRTGGSASALQAVFLVLDQWFNSSTLKGCAFTNAAIQLPNQLHPAYLAVLNHKQRTREWLLSLALAEGFDGPAARRLSSYLMILMEGAIITALVQNDLDAGRQAGKPLRSSSTASRASTGRRLRLQALKGRVAAVADNEWRVTVTLDDQAHAGRALQSLREHEVEDDVRRRLGHRVAVSADGARVFLYAGTEIAAREADRVVREVMAQRNIGADVAVDRWHPAAQEWQDADVAMPQTDKQRQAEHQRLEEEETRESLASGHSPRWEVRVELPSHHDAVALAGRLQAEGRPVIRRWKFLVLGANDEDDARNLARVIKQEAPAAASVHAEQLGPLLPFAQYGPISIW